jgi:hypothetical protein
VLACVVALAVTACTGRSLDQVLAVDDVSQAALAWLTSERAVAAHRDGGGVRVVEYRRENGGWVRQVLATASVGSARESVDLVSSGGDTRDEWNTWVFGVAAPPAARVEVADLDGVGGQVVDGAWVLVMHERDLTPGDLEWRFLDPSGAVVQSGSGLTRLPWEGN